MRRSKSTERSLKERKSRDGLHSRGLLAEPRRAAWQHSCALPGEDGNAYLGCLGMKKEGPVQVDRAFALHIQR